VYGQDSGKRFVRRSEFSGEKVCKIRATFYEQVIAVNIFAEMMVTEANQARRFSANSQMDWR
jgi:hypothetical protein